MKNAIILAAGKSNRLAPFTYEKPKGLFRVRGEILIERQIEQLREAGIKDIYVVVGFMKEKYFYLEQKYGVKLVVNNAFADKGNIFSLYVVREFLANTYICCADHYFTVNPFLEDTEYSYRACILDAKEKKEFKVRFSDCNVITELVINGRSDFCMVGHAYFNTSFSKRFVRLMEEEINNFGVAGLFWEEFFGQHVKDLTLYAKIYEGNVICEFDSVEDLTDIDQDFLINIDSIIVDNICSVLKCGAKEIKDIKVIDKGLTNVSFKFRVNEEWYVYRHPGSTAGNLVDRGTEKAFQYVAKEIGIDKSVIYMDISGWKISHLVQDLDICDLQRNEEQLKLALEYLRKLHSYTYEQKEEIKKFDTVEEGKKLMRIACRTKGDLITEFSDLTWRVTLLDQYVKQDGYQDVMCHNDTYAPNYLVTNKGEMYLIDWEYAGMNDPANDLGCILCRGEFSVCEIKKMIDLYLQREANWEEYRHYIAYIALSGYYWFCWGLYKGSVNDDDGFFFLPAYRSCIRFVDVALESYQQGKEIVFDEEK